MEPEFWDLYDENRRPLDRTIQRGEPMNPGEYHLTVNLWVMTPDGKLLITQRCADKEPNPGRWECSGGSALAGETSREAAVRELEEEVGLPAAETELIYLHTHVHGNSITDSWLVKKNVSLEALTLQPGEVADARLITFEQLEQLADSPDLMVPSCAERIHLCHDKFQTLVQVLTDVEGDND